MKYYTLYPKDTPKWNWIFFEDDQNGHLIVRPEYKDLVCGSCGKIDEATAIKRGVTDNFKIKSKLDWHGTFDDQICVTRLFRDIIETEKFQGLKFISIPSDPDRFLVICTNLVATNEKLAGFENIDLCSACGRYKEKVVGPMLQGMELPDSDLTFFASKIANENVKVSYRPIFASNTIVKVLKKAKIKGICYVPSF